MFYRSLSCQIKCKPKRTRRSRGYYRPVRRRKSEEEGSSGEASPSKPNVLVPSGDGGTIVNINLNYWIGLSCPGPFKPQNKQHVAAEECADMRHVELSKVTTPPHPKQHTHTSCCYNERGGRGPPSCEKEADEQIWGQDDVTGCGCLKSLTCFGKGGVVLGFDLCWLKRTPAVIAIASSLYFTCVIRE